MSKLLLIDTDRNKVVGEFCSTKEALKYAKEEDIKHLTLWHLRHCAKTLRINYWRRNRKKEMEI